MDNPVMIAPVPVSNNVLAQSLADVLEAIAFVSLMPLDPAADAPSETEMYWIEFSGAHRGAVELVVPRQFSQMLADNLLGPADDTGDGTVLDPRDGMKELLNVLCGKVLQHLPADDVARMNMGLPQHQQLDGETQWEQFRSSSECFDADGHPIAVRMRMEPLAP